MSAFPKPAKGTALMERKDARRKLVNAREDRKTAVRKRDGHRCRWPDCENCRRYAARLEVAHLVPLSLGGTDETSNLMLLDYLTHQGPHSLHAQTRRVEPLTDRGADGPCRFWELRTEGWTIIHVEDGR